MDVFLATRGFEMCSVKRRFPGIGAKAALLDVLLPPKELRKIDSSLPCSFPLPSSCCCQGRLLNNTLFIYFAEKKSDPDKMILILIMRDDLILTRKRFNYMCNTLSDKEYVSMIILNRNVQTHRCAAALKEPEYNVELLQQTDVLIPKLQYKHVPIYTILSEEQIQALEKKRCMKRQLFMVLLEKEAISRYMGLRSGQVVQSDDGKVRYVQ